MLRVVLGPWPLRREELQEPWVFADGRRATFKRDPSPIEDVSVVRQAQGELEMLLDNDNGDVFVMSSRAVRISPL